MKTVLSMLLVLCLPCVLIGCGEESDDSTAVSLGEHWKVVEEPGAISATTQYQVTTTFNPVPSSVDAQAKVQVSLGSCEKPTVTVWRGNERMSFEFNMDLAECVIDVCEGEPPLVLGVNQYGEYTFRGAKYSDDESVGIAMESVSCLGNPEYRLDLKGISKRVFEELEKWDANACNGAVWNFLKKAVGWVLKKPKLTCTIVPPKCEVGL